MMDRFAAALAVMMCALPWTVGAAGTMDSLYRAIDPTMTATTVVLTGHDLTLAQLIQIARYGARVELSADAKRREIDNYGMLLEAQAEGVPVYMLNRGGGLGRADVTLQGDPLSGVNQATLERRERAEFERGAAEGSGPEVEDEEIVRAAMALRANAMIFETPSPQLSRMVMDLLNARVAPVMQSRGSVGESDLYVLANINGAMVGRGDAYYRGIRMPAEQALRRARLEPLKPFALDSSTFANSNAYSTALAALLVIEGRQALDWADLADAIDLNGMNGSITPLTKPVQMKRPAKWLNWDAGRVLDMLKGGYLFDGDPQRILADADSLRASSIRQGAAWQAWAALRDSVLMQMNSSDHNPVVNVGLSPQDSWELATPQMMKYYVRGGAYSNGQHGYVVSSANWDPYPMVNEVESFTNALVNLGAAVVQRTLRFDNPFFTAMKPSDVIAPGASAPTPQGSSTATMSSWQEMQVLSAPVPAEGVATDSQANGDIESQAPLKTVRARQAVDLMMRLLAQDVITGTYWMDLRRLQNPSRSFGDAPSRAVMALRKYAAGTDSSAPRSGSGAAESKPPRTVPANVGYAFIKNTPAASFYEPALAEPGGEISIPAAN